MTKAAIRSLAGTEGPANVGRLVNGLQTAREFADAGDEVEFLFDGAGTRWIPELQDKDSNYHDLYRAITDDNSVCDYCSGAFGVDAAVNDSGLVRLDDHDGHPSIRSLVADGCELTSSHD